MNKVIFLASILFFVSACGGMKNSEKNKSSIQNETKLGLTTHSRCSRAEEVRGSNSIYRLTRAEIGNLQSITISSDTKIIHYSEALASSYLEDTATYRYVPENKSFFFKTFTKSLKLTFQNNSLGTIENDLTKQEFVVGILSYDDDSGYKISFLCQKI